MTHQARSRSTETKYENCEYDGQPFQLGPGGSIMQKIFILLLFIFILLILILIKN